MAIVTELKLQKNDSRANVYLDGEFVCGMEISVILKNGIKVGTEITEDRLEELKQESIFSKAYEKALSLIDRQKYTTRALKTKLKTKGYEAEIVDQVVEKLLDVGLVSDIDFAESFIRSSSNKSKRELESALITKGVPGAVISEALQDVEVDDEAVARNLAEKFMRYKDKTPENIKKLIAYLYRKGFGLSIAELVAREYGNDDFYD